MGDVQREDITKQLSFGRHLPDGRRERRTINPIAGPDLAVYRSLGLGSAVCLSLEHSTQAEILEQAIGKSYGSIEFFERA
jgi:hypothetical protein